MPLIIRRPFLNYKQASRLLSPLWWYPLRLLLFLFIAFVLACLSLGHAWASVFLWGVCVPLLPLVFIALPGLWRNLCPLATINQIPRALSLSLQWKLPSFMMRSVFAFSGLVFALLVSLRPILFETNQQALLLLLSAFAFLAFLGGVLFKGKSGWCGTFCPLAAVQKVYGQAPLLVVPNSFCKTCVACQKNCYDFNPRPSLLEDLNSPDHRYAWHRHVFLGMLPGLIYGFFSYRGLVDESSATYFRMLVSSVLLSGGLYFLLSSYAPISSYRLALCAICASLGVFYWFALPNLFSSLSALSSIRAEIAQDSEAFMGSLGALLPVVATSGEFLSVIGGWAVAYEQPIRFILFFILATLAVVSLLQELRFNWLQKKGNNVAVGNLSGLQKSIADQSGGFEVLEAQSQTFFLALPDRPVLEAMESAKIPIESGCRMGICGADPIVILQGEDNVEPAGREEQNTLQRLGLLGKARMACMMKVCGSVEISLDLSHKKAKPLSKEPGSAKESFSLGNIDSEIVVAKSRSQDSNKDLRIVVIGNGVAGSSAVQFARMISPYCKISQVAAEPYSFYNRMALSRLIYGRSGMNSLFLLDDEWFRKKDIDLWLNTFVSQLDLDSRHVLLSTGEMLPYDRLVLALGSRAIAPPFDDVAGTFTLRGANEAMAIRRWVQERKARRAVMVGGGLQGVELAIALRDLGLQVVLVHRHKHLIDRQGDQVSAKILREFLESKGITVLLEERVVKVVGNENGISEVQLEKRKPIAADLCVFSIGVRPQTQIAQDAELVMEEGAIAVNANMQTSRLGVYAVGDCARWGRGTTSGLWGIGLEMGRIAAYNMLGFDKNIDIDIYNTPYILKVPNFNLFCFGRTTPLKSDNTYTRGTDKDMRWWQIVINDRNKIVGGVFVNHNEMAMEVRRALRENIDASTLMKAA